MSDALDALERVIRHVTHVDVVYTRTRRAISRDCEMGDKRRVELRKQKNLQNYEGKKKQTGISFGLILVLVGSVSPSFSSSLKQTNVPSRVGSRSFGIFPIVQRHT